MVPRVAWLCKSLSVASSSSSSSHRRGTTLLVCAHANGFCKETFFPLWKCLEEEAALRGGLGDDVDVLALDLPGHGDSGKFALPVSMQVLSDAVLVALDEYLASKTPSFYSRVIGLGHSIGATALLTAELSRPQTFQSLFMVEPILILVKERQENAKLAELTLKRRSAFSSKEDAFDNWQGKGMFENWHPECLRTFCEYGLKTNPSDISGGVSLKCDPAQEADIYRVTTPVTFRLGDIQAETTILNSSHHETHVPAERAVVSFRQLQRPGKLIMLPPPASHFMVMDAPEQVAIYLANHLVKACRSASTTESKL